MLVARRDSELEDDRTALGGASANRFKRIMTALQMAGTLVGIPVALASGYSVYRSNFSPDATCQGLRSNIVAMLDKSADASTLRTLVRRDVAAFEQTCGAVDPDAVAAFKTLLAAPKKPVVTKAAPAKAEVKTHEAAQRLEAAKPPAKAPVGENMRDKDARATEMSDANWLAAVRGALVTHDRDRPQTDIAAAPAAREKPLAPPAPRDMPVVAPPAAAAPTALAPPAPAIAAADDHPVPPAAIPEAEAVPAPSADQDAHHADAKQRPRWRALLGHIPGLNRVMESD